MLKLAENLHAFNGVDAQLGFQILVQAQHVLRIAGELGNNAEQGGTQVQGRGGGRCTGGGRGCSRKTRQGCQLGLNGVQCPGLGKALHSGLHGRCGFCR